MRADRLPAGWSPANLAEITAINPSRTDTHPAPEDDVSFIPMSAVEPLSGRIDTSLRRRWKEVAKGYTKFQDNDVLFAKITPCMENGKCAVAADLCMGIGAGSTEFHVLRPTGAVRPPFLRHYLVQEDFRKLARSKMTGTAGQLRVPASALAEHDVPLPPLGEQDRILAVLDSYLSRLDDAIANLERARRNLTRYRASVLQAAVEGRLVPTEAELARAEGRSYESASVLLQRILIERRKRWEASGKKGKYEEPFAPDVAALPELPVGWCWASVDQLAAAEPYSLCDGPFGSNLKSEHYTEAGPRVVRLQNIGDGKFIDIKTHIPQAHFDTLHRHRVFAGDLLVASLGETLPRACIVPATLGPAIVKADCLRFKPDVERTAARYLVAALNSPPVRAVVSERVHGIGRPRMGLGGFRETAIPLPPHAEQLRIAYEVDRLMSIAGEADLACDRQIARCHRLRQSILKWAFEGRLVDQDPNDEPASMLLKRIRAEQGDGQPTARRTPKAKP